MATDKNDLEARLRALVEQAQRAINNFTAPRWAQEAGIGLAGLVVGVMMFVDIDALFAETDIPTLRSELATLEKQNAAIRQDWTDLRGRVEALERVRTTARWCGLKTQQVEEEEITSVVGTRVPQPGVGLRVRGNTRDVLLCSHFLFPPKANMNTVPGKINVSGETAVLSLMILSQPIPGTGN